jgi:hypothetical protein
MKYGIILGVIQQQKDIHLTNKIVRLMAGVKSRNSCKSLFKSSEILTLLCENMFSRMNFNVNNQEHFQTNSAIHTVNILQTYLTTHSFFSADEFVMFTRNSKCL